MTRRVLVLGGGFAGVSAAGELTRRLRREGLLARRGRGAPGGGSDRAPDGAEPVEVVLVSADNFFVFQPLLADIISGTIETTHVVAPLRRMLPGVDVEVAYVERIEPSERRVWIRHRLDDEESVLEYDALVIALGSVTDFRAVPGMAEHAIGVRTLGDAFYLRNRALSVLEEARIESDPAERRRLLDFVVVGGGATGVEVAAELHDLLHVAARTFGGFVEEKPRVFLVHGGPQLLPNLGDRLARYTTRKMAQLGVELRLGRRIVRVAPDHVELDDGSTIETRTVVSTVGNAPHPVVAGIPGAPTDQRGWIVAEPTFEVRGLENVWALGDVATIPDPRTGKAMPATAQHAIREGPWAARNVVAALTGRPQRPFDYRELGMLVSLGRFKAVGLIFGVPVSGLVGWFFWRGYYLLRAPSLDRKIRIAIDWALDFVLPKDVVQINVQRTRTRPGEIPTPIVGGEPVSAGARDDVEDGLAI